MKKRLLALLTLTAITFAILLTGCVIIPALSEPLVRNLRATTPESESH